ncbi:MAG TPA: tetratricopeptide repeat protein [Candidatus Solibacter sp.]|nr:tetratricopeptide repeat protein [Candidatus Solibacter sp.]
MRRRYSWVFFTLLLLAPASCLGQEPLKVALSGSIREAGTGHVIGDARIELQNAMGTPIGFAYSDRNGTYQFDDIPGDCYVSVQHDGYESAREFVRPTGAGHVYRDILLRATGGAAVPKVAPAVSEHQLSIPRNARESFDKGVQLIVEKSDYRGAVAQFARAISKYPSYYEAYAAMGLAQNKMGDAAAAEVALRKSISLSSEKYPQAILDLASMFNSQKKFSDAEPLLRKAIALDASSWRAQFQLAVALSAQNRYKDAVASATAARDLKPDNPQIYLFLYDLHIRADDFPGALADTQSYLKLAPTGALADRVRSMQEKIQQALQTSGNNSVPTSEAKPAPPVESAAKAVASPPAGSSAAGQPDLATSQPSAPPAADNTESAAEDTSEESPDTPENNSGMPPRVDDLVPEVAVNVPCILPAILRGAGRRAEQLLNSMQKFDASERVESYRLNAAGVPGGADVRSFDYVAVVSRDSHGEFQLQEYRNGEIVSPRQFPAGIATANLSAHALIFHPRLAPGFDFACEGLGQWKGRSTWLVHFEERPNQRDAFRSYIVDGIRYPVRLVGRAWIDAGNYQVVHLESDLVKPVENIRLTREHISIGYAAVRFRSRQQLWLPQTADLYFELKRRRYYRRHTFTNFKIFSTDSTQQVQGPKESYCFTNTSDSLVTGILSAIPLSGKDLKPASLTLAIPAKSTVCKTVGAGMDVNIPIEFLASSSFAYDGPAGSVEDVSYLPNRTPPQLISKENIPAAQRP